MNSQVIEKLQYFEFKGIQMEALGYIPIRQLILSPNYSDLEYWYLKYGIFQKRNSKDIETLKANAMQSQNYDKVDEFYQYQDYLDRSYFNQVVKSLKHTSKMRIELNNEAWLSDFCSGEIAKDYEFLDEKFDDLCDKELSQEFSRTQDLGVWVGKYSEIPKYSEVTKKWKNSKFYTTDEDDPIFGYIKFNQKCNYKPGLANSLSIFEHPLMLQIYKGLIHLTSFAHSKSGDINLKNKVKDSILNKISLIQDILDKNSEYFGHQDEQELTKKILDFFNNWLSIIHLVNILLPLKDLKGNQETFSKSLEELHEEIASNIELININISEVNLENLKIIEEEKFDETTKTSEYNAYFKSKFSHTQIQNKFMNFLTNYVLGYYFTALTSLNQVVSSLGPKKKKASFSKTPLAKIVNLPLKETLKKVKGWINGNIELYSDKNLQEQFERYIDNVIENTEKYNTNEDYK